MLQIINGSVLLDGSLVRATVTVDGAEIEEISDSRPVRGAAFDATGLLVLPGIIDIHGDAFERSLMPRPGVGFDERIALLDIDRQMLANGITTAFHGVTMSWEPGLRSTEYAARIVEAIEDLKAEFEIDTRVHLRHETFNLDAEPLIAGWLAAGRIGCLAFNDHMEGTIKTRHRPDKIRKHIERTGLSDEAFFNLVDGVYGRADEVGPSLDRLAEAAVDAGVPVLSHDDITPAMRDAFRAMGVTIAEFPINEETARNAARHGDAIVFGAPNVLRGGSHTGCPSAADMVRGGLCTVLASDYYYPALLHAPFALAAQGDAALADAWRLVSSGPAAALGLRDRGTLDPGKRADIILVDASRPKREKVVASIINGRIRMVTEPQRLSS
ncbi:MAG: alpha-D-ribose 1-methylphosphonate 5-triphosphate diphosphatase [Rhizobiaceae bacterium]|nr:alpha-D-ribose 1-methylphosphonate 5-triphosphate diphosphatase [Rhizobiaceae bacterium]